MICNTFIHKYRLQRTNMQAATWT